MEDKSKKKNQDELKKKLHELIDSIEDEHTLSMLNEDVVPYIIENRAKELDDIEDNLTDEQLKDLDEAIAEADRGETISYEEFKKNMDEWLTKLKSNLHQAASQTEYSSKATFHWQDLNKATCDQKGPVKKAQYYILLY